MKENDILQAQDVRFRYDTEQPNFAVDGVSMEVHRGEFVAVLGANGCGKSTWPSILTPFCCRKRHRAGGGYGHPHR